MTRPQWLALAGILLASAVAAIAMAQWLTEKRLAERRVGLVNALGYTARALEEEGRASALGAAKLMGLNDPVLKAAALGVQAPDAVEVLQRLSIARALFDADGAYVIAGNGIVVAHSTEGVRSTGKDLAFRPYFKAAMRGAASSYAAVGSVTGERGLYYAAPLYRENRLASVVIGVVMLKLPGSKIDQLLRFAGDDVMLLSPQEIVFSATRAPWLLGMNPPVLESRVAAVRALHQFAGRFDQTAPVALPFDVNSESVAVAGQRHIVLRHKVEWGDPAGPWALVSLHDVDALVAPELRWMLGLGAFAILATLALLAAQVRLGRRHIAAGRARYSTLGTALALSPVSVVIADVDGVIDWVNPHFLQDTGYTWAQLKGQHTGLIVPPETQPEAYADMLSTVRAGKPWRGDFQNQRKDGSFFTAHTVVSPTFDAAGQVNGIVGLQEDTTQAMQLKAQLAEQIAFQSVLLDTIPIPVFYKDAQARYLGCNRQFFESFGLTQAELVGRHLSELEILPIEARAFYSKEDERVIKHSLTVRRQVKVPYANGQQRSTLYNVQGFRRQDGSPGGLIGTLVDISEQEAVQDQLRLARDAADAASRAKGDFLANMSHEIRTPLNAIIGMAYLVMKTELNQRQADFVSKIRQSGKSLLAIIDDILDISRVEAGKLTIERVPFELENVISQVMNVVADKVGAKGLRVTSEVAPDVPPMLMGDPLRLGQILVNYANNAVKFTHQGEIRITVRVKEKFDTDLLLGFEVIDTGIGVSVEQAQRLFQSFEQADPSTTRQYGGSGLGLAISKGLAGLMGGTVGVDSVLGQGCTFWFTARVGLATPARQGVQTGFGQLGDIDTLTDDYIQARAALSALGGARILLVEDNDLNQQVASELLADAGFKVDIAQNGEVAVQMVAARNLQDLPYDIVLMDLQMPVMDGLSATAEIRSDPRNLSLPIAAMTANAMPQDRARCDRAGMAGFVVKPVDPLDLWRTLALLIRPRAGMHPMAVASTAASASAATGASRHESLSDLAEVAGLDVRLGLQRVMGRSALYLALLRRFAVSQGDAIRRTRDALDGGDAPLAKRIVHTLKGVAGSIGATDLAGATTALESCLQAPAPQSETQAAMTQQAMSVAARHLDGLVHALHEKLSALPASGAAPAAMADALVTVCKRLARLLKEQDFEAEEVFDQHQALLKAALGADFAELKTALDAFKFDQALIALNQALLARQVRI